MSTRAREAAFLRLLGAKAEIHPSYGLQVLNALRRDRKMLAELMALCAAPGPAPDDSSWEFVGESGDPMVRNVWVHAGDPGLPAAFNLPEPNRPPTDRVPA